MKMILPLRYICVVSIVFALSAVAFGQKALEISTVSVDASATQIKITGVNLGSEAPQVFLGLEDGTSVELKTAFVSDTEVVAFYEFFRLKRATYRITVQAGTDQIDSLGVTLGSSTTKIDSTDTERKKGKGGIIVAESESASSMYVDLTTDQTIGGEKTFTEELTGTIITANQYEINGKGKVLSTPGFENTFVGEDAGTSNASSYNTFVGANAGADNSTGQRNSFFGSSAGESNVSGTRNAFFGQLSGFGNTSGTFNSFFGASAGHENTTGLQNNFFGAYSGFSTTTGNQNQFVGTVSGYSNSTGSNNSFFGFFAGMTNTTGDNNTLLGTQSDVGAGNLTFATAVGSGASVTASNTVQLGRNGSDVVRIGTTGAAGATDLCLNVNNEIATCSSSSRYKSDIKNFSTGLDMIKKLRPVSYFWTEGKMADVGFVAEEIAEINPLFSVYKNGRVEGIKYDRLSVVFVNAIQEQQKKIQEQEAAIKEQKTENEILRKKLEMLTKLVCSDKPDAELCK